MYQIIISNPGMGDLSFGQGEMLMVIKIMFLIGLSMYAFFALLVLRQSQMMLRALNGLLELPVRLLAYIQLAIALLILGGALVIL